MGAALPSDGRDPTGDARPVHRVYVDGFWMDRTEVTNAAFARFVAATGYVTVAERVPGGAEASGARVEQLVAGSVVFAPPDGAVPLDDDLRWWRWQPGASWRQPFGPGSRAEDDLPVVHVAFEDAQAYARWARKRLPREAEFEFAARGGLSGRRYAWGDELKPNGRYMANTFQGHFPEGDTGDDGAMGLAAVGRYPANGYGLFDVTGNAWEWCADWYRADTYAARAGLVTRNPGGPSEPFDPADPGVPKRVQRGGSFLCSSEYCARYLVAARGKGDPTVGAAHLGFRCVRDP
jgi:sulfatase modifying factor 1